METVSMEAAHGAALDVLCKETHHELAVVDSREVAENVWVVFLSDYDTGHNISVTVAPARDIPGRLALTWWDDNAAMHVKGINRHPSGNAPRTRLELLRSAEQNGDEVVRLTPPITP